MTKIFQKNDRAKLNDSRSNNHGKEGTILTVNPTSNDPYEFHIDGADWAYWYPAEYLAPIVGQVAETQQATQDTESPHDFSSSGLGIGGLSSHTETPIIPTVAQMEQLDRMEASATYCQRCGQSDIFDGAMFTTGGGDICDDCF